MKMKITLVFIFILLINPAFGSEYHVKKSEKNSVVFVSDAKIETFEGKTSKIDGYLNLKDNTNLYEAELYFEVDLNSVDTGIGLRNRHMREEYLHTDKFQFATFTGKINEVKKINDNIFDVKVSGEMNIHGVTRKSTISGKIEFQSNGELNITSNFSVKLPDYKIEVPKMMFLKISEDIKLSLNFNLSKAK